MFDPKVEFAYASRRAREEAVAAINAGGIRAAAAHRELSRLYSARALLALLDPDRALLSLATGATASPHSASPDPNLALWH